MRTYQLLLAVTVVCITTPLASAVCIVPNVLGTADLPPTVFGCEYIPPVGDQMHILPPAITAGNTIDIDPELFGPPFNISEVAGGSLGGHTQTYDASLQMQMSGTGGTFGTFNRTISIPVSVVTESALRTPGNAVQTFPTEMISLSGQLFGDPDFNTLEIKAGTGQGLPAAPGITRLTRQGAAGSPFAIDSFFDLTYEIIFTGAPGSVLHGLGGSTIGPIRLQIGTPVPEPTTATLVLAVFSGVALSFKRNRLPLCIC